jgi:hypothetical protein
MESRNPPVIIEKMKTKIPLITIVNKVEFVKNAGTRIKVRNIEKMMLIFSIVLL